LIDLRAVVQTGHGASAEADGLLPADTAFPGMIADGNLR